MQYEVTKITNGDITVDGQGVASIPVGFITGVVGNTYPQFIAGNSMVVSISGYGAKTADAISAEVSAQVAAESTRLYPNT